MIFVFTGFILPRFDDRPWSLTVSTYVSSNCFLVCWPFPYLFGGFREDAMGWVADSIVLQTFGICQQGFHVVKCIANVAYLATLREVLRCYLD